MKIQDVTLLTHGDYGSKNKLSHLHPDHLKDLRKSGLTDDTIEAAGIDSVRPHDISKINPDPRIRSLLAFPYPGCDGFTRYKLYPSLTDRDGHVQKYHQKKGTGSHLYIPPQTDGVLENPLFALNIVEGEKKALRLTQEGIPAIGIGGIWSWTQNGCAVQGQKGKTTMYNLDSEKTAQTYPRCQDGFLDYSHRRHQKTRPKELVMVAHSHGVLSASEVGQIFAMAGLRGI